MLLRHMPTYQVQQTWRAKRDLLCHGRRQKFFLGSLSEGA